MINFDYDEEEHIYSIWHNTNVRKVLAFKIHEGRSCSFWIEPLKNATEVTIDKWKFSIGNALLTDYPKRAEIFGDSLELPVEEDGHEYILLIKKDTKFSDANEIWDSMKMAINNIISGNINNTNGSSNDGSIKLFYFKK